MKLADELRRTLAVRVTIVLVAAAIAAAVAVAYWLSQVSP